MAEKKAEPKLSTRSVEEWAEDQTFTTTEEIEIPKLMADRVIGQEDAVEVMRKAAGQKRHVMLIGEPGTGKSMLANSMVEYLPKEELQDIVAYHNPEDFNEPRIRVFPAGKGKAVVAEQKAAAAAQKNQRNTVYIYACLGLVLLGVLGAILFSNLTIALIAMIAAFLILILFRGPGQAPRETAIVPKLLVGHDPGDLGELAPLVLVEGLPLERRLGRRLMLRLGSRGRDDEVERQGPGDHQECGEGQCQRRQGAAAVTPAHEAPPRTPSAPLP